MDRPDSQIGRVKLYRESSIEIGIHFGRYKGDNIIIHPIALTQNKARAQFGSLEIGERKIDEHDLSAAARQFI